MDMFAGFTPLKDNAWKVNNEVTSNMYIVLYAQLKQSLLEK